MARDTVLIIEDEPQIRAMLREAIIRHADYRVLMARDGREGLELALQERPDVILLDLMLPYLNGMDLMRALLAENLHIPIIVITAHGSAEMILKAFRLGAKDYLQKPFRIQDVWTALEHALAEEHLRREKEQLTHALTAANRRLQLQLEHWIALNAISKAILSTLDEEEVLHRVMQTVSEILHVEAASLLLFDEAEETLHFALTLQGDAACFSEITLRKGEGIAGWVAEHRMPLLVPNVQEDPRFNPAVDRRSGFETRSILCVPLMLNQDVLGVLEVLNKKDPESAEFTPEDLRMLTTLASWVTIALENARLHRALQDAAALQAIKQAVITLAHHINNQLLIFSLELDGVEQASEQLPPEAQASIRASRRCIQEINDVVQALDRLQSLRTVPYVGDTRMMDLEGLLKAHADHSPGAPQEER